MNREQEIAARLCRWFNTAGRALPFRKTKDPYHIWVSEIMAQQTRIAALIPYYEKFVAAFPTVTDLANAEEETVLAHWQGLGYYARARNLHKAAKIVRDEYQGALPKDAQALRALPGIGAYTAGAIASIAFDLPVPAVDGNVLRVFARLFGIESDVLKPQTNKQITALVTDMMGYELPSVFTQAVMELGALVCLPASPNCAGCPIRELCTAYEQGKTEALPVRAAAPEKKTVPRYIALVFDANGERVLLRKRTEKLLHNLFEFPSFDTEQERADFLAALNAQNCLPLPPSRHVFTHLVWAMDGVRANSSAPAPSGFFFAERAALDQFAIPTALKLYKEAAK
ncbi:MAG: A/G-specific adenine glycosylase [Clostridia bacterium]|nr:A/G-specific adenine glycosylase [Clostridia bacterium]